MVTLRVDGHVVAVAERAHTPLRRAIGLLGRRGMEAPAGLLIQPCGSVHTWFMQFAIDVVYLDPAFRVVKIAESLRPWRFSLGGRKARYALELPAGQARRAGVDVGDRLEVAP